MKHKIANHSDNARRLLQSFQAHRNITRVYPKQQDYQSRDNVLILLMKILRYLRFHSSANCLKHL